LCHSLLIIPRDKLDRIEERQHIRTRNDQRTNLLKWLTSLEYGSKQSDCMRKRQPGTGQWLLRNELFEKWEASSQQTLYCPGIPGAGKTIQSAIVVDHLQSKFHNDGDEVGIAYIFCNYQPQQKQRPEELLLSLCKQLILSRSSNVPSSILDLYQQVLKKGTRPNLEHAYSILDCIAKQFKRLYIFWMH
jgi:Cdc6-like AAA superfamily ATPase